MSMNITEAYEDMTKQRDWLLEAITLIHSAYELSTPIGTMNTISSIIDDVWNKFQRPTMRTEEDFKDAIDLTPEAMLKERIESYDQINGNTAKVTIETIIEPKKELSIEDVFGDTVQTKYWIIHLNDRCTIRSDEGPILRFSKSDPNAERKAKLALKLLNQCEPDDIDLLIEMLY